MCRYPGVAATAGDNCVLSGQAVAELVSSSSLLVDDAWDLYQRIESGYNCRGAQTGYTFIYSINSMNTVKVSTKLSHNLRSVK